MASDTVLYRYTPPTCRLEISAKQSSLSRWTGRPVLKHLRFQLCIHDAHLLNQSSTDKQAVTIRGDRRELELLHDAVRQYVQTFLSEATTQLDATFSQSSREYQFLSTEDGISLSQLGATEDSSSHQSEPQEQMPDGGDDASDAELPSGDVHPAGIYLHPQALTAHVLHLGPLTNQTISTDLSLSTLQLFDLVTALDEYVLQADTLPMLSPPQWLVSPTKWAQAAAALLITVGLTASIAQLLEETSPTLESSSAPTNSQTASSEDQQIATQLPALESDPQDLERAESGLSEPPAPPAGSLQTKVSELPNISPDRSPLAVPQPVPSSALPPPPPPGATSPSATFPAPSSDFEASERIFEREIAPSAGATRSAQRAPEAGQVNEGTIFDAIPQVAEVRAYFQQQWQPQPNLNQTIEYSLLIGSDGSLQSIIPLGQVAGNYIDRTGIPLVGDPFVSPLSSSKIPRIRLVLEPDGGVQTFLEGVE